MAASYRSLRIRLTLWAVVVFAAIHVTLGAGLLLLRTDTRQQHYEQRVLGHARRIVALLTGDGARPWTNDELASLLAGIDVDGALRPVALEMRAADGQVVARARPNGAAIPLPEGEIDEPVFRSVRLPEMEADLRVLTVPFDGGPGGRAYLQLATPYPPSSDPASRFSDLFLFTVPLGLLAAGLAAWIVASRAVGPIERMAEAFMAVSPATLERRIDVGPADSEITSLQRELNDALRRLEEGYRSQEAFIGNVSHELKTPVATLLSEAQVMDVRHSSPEELEHFRRSVEEETRGLGRLIESILVLARSEHGHTLVAREEVSLRDVLLDVVRQETRAARSRDVRIVPEIRQPDPGVDADVLGDAELLQTMLGNVVRNAVRFSPSGETVDVRLELAPGRARFVVRDRGPGVPVEHLEHLFERFWRLPRDAERPRGTGLGLAIASSIARLHGGSITARNRPDLGCEFFLRLPLRPPEPPAQGGGGDHAARRPTSSSTNSRAAPTPSP